MMQKMNVSLVVLLFVRFLLVHAGSATTVPYTPSHVLVSPPHNDSLVYLLLSDNSEVEGQSTTAFLSLNVSRSVDAGSPNYTTLLDQAPFHRADLTAAFVPVIDQHGTIKVYAGDCRNASDPGVVWHFTPDPTSPTGNGTWNSLSVDARDSSHGPDYLAAGFAYTVSDATESSVYTFGGMCPWQHNASANWVASANYSQAMTVMHPSTDGSTSYHLDDAGERAPPVAEAGFSVTPLQPTYATATKGEPLHQQDFLLIGGQTQQAFLNMSEIAIYSLPQESWSFVAVESDSTGAKTELAIRDTAPMVEPRSGHTAVLTPDGSKVVVVGGWVGNTSVPASPQLAILETGAGYGGYSSWTWKIPSPEDSFLADGTGIYGHGTAMLPGGVMMIAGGYRMSQSSKRSTAGPQQNPQAYFYNVTSNSWVTSYSNPNRQTADGSRANSGALSFSQKLAIGVGIGVGIPVLIAIGVVAWKLSRKYRFRARDNELRKLALGAQRSHFWGRDTPEMSSSIRGPSFRSYSDQGSSWSADRGNPGNPKWSDNGDVAVAERTGLLMDGLSSTKGNRQMNNGPSYRFSGQAHEPSRNIHPIDEREEYEEAHDSDSLIAHDPSPAAGALDAVDIPHPYLEAPFLTPQNTNIDREQENTRAAFEENEFMASVGSRPEDGRSTPSSPGKGDRPSSDRSDSPRIMRLGVVPKSRATILNDSTGLPSNGRQSPYKSVAASTHSKETARTRSDSATTPSLDNRYSSESFSTAHTTLSQRQAEGEHLLGEVPEENPPELPSKVAATSRPKASEWIGNVRRVLSGTRKWTVPDKDSNDNKSLLNSNATPMASGIDRSSTVLESRRTSPQDQDDESRESMLPRRAVSVSSAELFRRKQGARDWGASIHAPRETTVSGNLNDDVTESDAMLDHRNTNYNEDDDDTDWDIETAAEGRSVQVTYTVPKERLRVVNATAKDMDSMSSGSQKVRRGGGLRIVSG